MEKVEAAQQSWDLIIFLVATFGTIISVLLGIIGFMINRWTTRLDVRLDGQDHDIGELKVTTAKHTTEIKNIHHRLKIAPTQGE
jgi:hypothetical protein